MRFYMAAMVEEEDEWTDQKDRAKAKVQTGRATLATFTSSTQPRVPPPWWARWA